MAHLKSLSRGWKAGLAAVAAAGLTIPLVATTAQTKDSGPRLTEKQQAELDRKLEGRTAGEPIGCISQTQIRHMTPIGEDVLLYEMRNGTIYVNTPYAGCPNVDRDALVTRTPGTRLCSGDIAEVRDFVSGSTTGSCSFSEFTPYRRADNGD